MKYLLEDVTLSRKDYTNHSIRSTVITNLDRAGFKARHIIAVTGHKSETTIKQYTRKCPEGKKREMCEALGNKLMAKKPKMDVKQELKSSENTSETALTSKTPKTATTIDIDIGETAPDSVNFNDNLDLFPVDDTSDDMLLQVLNDPDKQTGQNVTTTTVTNTISNTSITVPVQVKPNLMA